MSGLAQALTGFDGRNISVLSEARVLCGSSEVYLDDLVALCRHETPLHSVGATWILKAEFEDGAVLSAALTALLVEGLEQITAWQAQLHLCQSVGYLDLTPAQARIFADWAAVFGDHPRPFLRAWSLHACVQLAEQDPSTRETARALLKKAHKDQSASVRARARKYTL